MQAEPILQWRMARYVSKATVLINQSWLAFQRGMVEKYFLWNSRLRFAVCKPLITPPACFSEQ